MDRVIVGKTGKQIGVPPAIALFNPKFPRNLGAVLRAASCFGIEQVWFSGDRINLDEEKRLPREERMKGYDSTQLIQYDYFFDQFENVTPVAVEITPTSEILTTFDHPDDALYVFGPEDGSIPSHVLQHCHRFVTIPTLHCTNLAAAVYIVMYDRHMKRQLAGKEPIVPASEVLNESRGMTSFCDKELG